MRAHVTVCSIVQPTSGEHQGQAGRVERVSREKDENGSPLRALVKLDARIVDGAFGPTEVPSQVVELDTTELKVLLAH
jgi:hypothetical protein